MCGAEVQAVQAVRSGVGRNRAMNEGLVSRCAARQSEGGACRSPEDLWVRCVGTGVTEAGLTGREGGSARYHETRAHALGLGMLARGKEIQRRVRS